MARRSRKTETIVGLFVLASLLLLLVLVVFIGRRQSIFEGHYQLHGFFKSVGGLQTGADVQLAGISVGYVKDIRFSPDNKVNVILSVNQKQMERIRADSVATIKTFGLMGDRYLAITVGSDMEPIIPRGGTIKTQETLDIDEVLDSARPTFENLQNSIQNISILTDRLANKDSDVANILRNVKEMTANINKGEGTIGALIQRDDLYEKANSVLETTQQTMQSFRSASSNVEHASQELPVLMHDLKSSVAQLDSFSTQAAAAAAEIYQLVGAGEEVMANAKDITNNLKSASEDIADITPRVKPLIRSADAGVAEAREAIDSAKKSWLLRGGAKPPIADGPIVYGARDILQPEIVK